MIHGDFEGIGRMHGVGGGGSRVWLWRNQSLGGGGAKRISHLSGGEEGCKRLSPFTPDRGRAAGIICPAYENNTWIMRITFKFDFPPRPCPSLRVLLHCLGCGRLGDKRVSLITVDVARLLDQIARISQWASTMWHVEFPSRNWLLSLAEM